MNVNNLQNAEYTAAQTKIVTRSLSIVNYFISLPSEK